jgi:trigger factor
MEEWAIVKRHVADEITLLCDQHHREKTGGLLPKEAVLAANSKPYNLQKNTPKPYTFHFFGTHAEIILGGNKFTCEDKGYGTTVAALVIDNLPLVGFVIADGHLLFNLVAFDEFNQKILHIKNNHLFYATMPWDIQLVGRTLTIREAHRKILIEIEFCPPNKVIVNRGRFLFNGVETLISPDRLMITNNSISLIRMAAVDCPIGLRVGTGNSGPAAFAFDQIPRYNFDRTQAEEFENNLMNN